ncbi:MAG: M20/M25/M40 family metallo-hydrolase [Gemmatimonadales bacterium]
MDDLVSRLLAHERVRAARAHVERTDEATLARQAALSAVPAPTGQEARRAARVAELLRQAGLADVAIDEAGNVRGWYGDAGRRNGDGCVILSAHLDTVFGAEVDVSVARRGEGHGGGGSQRLEGPGIADNARGLTALVTVADALVQAGVRPVRPILFAATVGEEGAGDLCGAKHLLNGGSPRPAAFIALDGAGLERIVHRALGSRRYRVIYRGPGGHSWAAFGVANPAAAVGRAIAVLADVPAHHAPRTTCAVVGLGGGTGLNSIPREAWLDLDLRSEDPEALAALDRTVQGALTRARDVENARRAPATAPLQLETRLVGDRPSGVTPRAHPLVQVALAATRALGGKGGGEGRPPASWRARPPTRMCRSPSAFPRSRSGPAARRETPICPPSGTRTPTERSASCGRCS